MAKALRNTGVTALSLLVLVAATGWLYVIRPHSGGLGPSMPDALPLDELANKARLPLLVFVAVWGCAGLLLGMLARAARLERLTAALVLALGAGTFEFLAVGTSFAVVRQVPLHAAFHATAQARSVYAPALLAGLGGALCGRARSSARSRMPLVLAWSVAAAGALGLADALLPSKDGSFSRRSRRMRCGRSRTHSSGRLRLRCCSPRRASPAAGGAPGRSRCSCSAARAPCTFSTASTQARLRPPCSPSRSSPTGTSSTLPVTRLRDRASS